MFTTEEHGSSILLRSKCEKGREMGLDRSVSEVMIEVRTTAGGGGEELEVSRPRWSDWESQREGL